MIRSVPSAASSLANASPIPEEAPVTSARRQRGVALTVLLFETVVATLVYHRSAGSMTARIVPVTTGTVNRCHLAM